MQDTIAAIATPVGEGGINIIRISGDRALELAGRLFHAGDGTPVAKLEPLRVCFGEVRDPSNQQLIDQTLLTFFRAPKSYTGEDVVEIHCHGGAWVSSRILQILLDQGARLADPGEFTRRAFLNGKLDLPQAEAVADIIHAASDKALSTALSHLQGKLSQTLNAHYDQLVNVLSHLEVAIDFPEEGLEFDQKKDLADKIAGVRDALDRLAATYRQGKVYREGLKVALVGKPNVGKSSLLNALLQEDRAIVTAIPGTTRDVLEETVCIRDIHIRIMDTAGLRHSPEPVEELGISRTRTTIEGADLVLSIFDGSQELDANDDILIDAAQGRPCLIIINKCDLPQVLDPAPLQERLTAAESIALSVATGSGLDRLKDAIHQFAVGGRSTEDSVVITRERHRQALKKATEALARATQSLQENRSEDLVAVDLNAALDSLGGLLGKTLLDDLLDRIFSDFCIGK